AYIDGTISDEQALRIIRNHGADKILFASDCPWHPSCRERKMLERLSLTDTERELISHVNAEKLLNIC
ncbi:MAG: amidohydrolase family protein, partial [Oscillospiraceae bacterium]|nr:amidohydrolase family protein [Oscillospiraceae bacterium]